MKGIQLRTVTMVLLGLLIGVGGCGGDGGGSAPATYRIGGTIAGLTAPGLVLANGSDTVSPGSGATSFAFATALPPGSSYAVTVRAQPSGALCQTASGTGRVGNSAVTNIKVTCVPAYALGGMISGLTASGLVLANGGDTVSPAAGATSFVFPTALANGSAYQVTIKRQPDTEMCRIFYPGLGYIRGAADAGVTLFCTRPWTSWVSGAKTVYAEGVYGTQGVAAATNLPAARSGSASWADSAGNLWLFGGFWGDSTGRSRCLNDLWRYSPDTGQWTWISGSSAANALGVYGTQGAAGASNVPGGRFGAASWADSAGSLWLFGGWGYDSTGTLSVLNDLWRYDLRGGQWTWVSGSNTGGASAVYGTQSVAAAGNVPSARQGAVSWIDDAGNLWLFGGNSSDVLVALNNDLWRYSPGTGLWTWVSGSNAINQWGVYGSKGVAAAGNVPTARTGSDSWIDSAGNFWLFGGLCDCMDGVPDASPTSQLSDLWRYSPATNQWTWVSGSSSIYEMPVYGTQGNADPRNTPGARDSAVSWTDSAGNFWLFGGLGFFQDFTVSGGAIPDGGVHNDLWRYSPASGQWTWVGGSPFVPPNIIGYGDPGWYITQGSRGVPGARGGAASWVDTSGNLWLFGGNGHDSGGISGELNDLWMF